MTQSMTVRIDPITFEVIANALSSSADEMAPTVMRSAYSPVVRDSMDYSTALCDRTGQVIAQGLTLAVQLGAFPDAMRHLMEQFDGDMNPGDVFVFNDPYGSGGQHLPDIYVIKPIHRGGVLQGYAATMAHHCDVGGITPGSTAMHATEIFRGELRLPIVRLYEAGQPNSTAWSIILRNTRLPVQVEGDPKAQVAACIAGERGLLELFERYGETEIVPYFDALQARAERLMRAEIAALPDGEYSYCDYLDGFGDTPEPIRIQVRLTIRGEEIEVDLDGTSPQVPAAINCPIAMVNSVTYCAIRCIGGPDIPNRDGYMRPIHVKAPSGTIVNPVLPAACAARGVIGYRVFDATMGALVQVVPERVIAGCESGPTLFSIGGWRDGKPFVLTEVMVGTWGARAGIDGPEGISNPAAHLSNQPIELIETELPQRTERRPGHGARSADPRRHGDRRHGSRRPASRYRRAGRARGGPGCHDGRGGNHPGGHRIDRRAGLHRYPQPLGLHPVGGPSRGQRAGLRGHAGGDRQLRFRLRADPRPRARRRQHLRLQRHGAADLAGARRPSRPSRPGASGGECADPGAERPIAAQRARPVRPPGRSRRAAQDDAPAV
jgi:N-methylhydantoinase B